MAKRKNLLIREGANLASKVAKFIFDQSREFVCFEEIKEGLDNKRNSLSSELQELQKFGVVKEVPREDVPENIRDRFDSYKWFRLSEEGREKVENGFEYAHFGDRFARNTKEWKILAVTEIGEAYTSNDVANLIGDRYSHSWCSNTIGQILSWLPEFRKQKQGRNGSFVYVRVVPDPGEVQE